MSPVSLLLVYLPALIIFLDPCIIIVIVYINPNYTSAQLRVDDLSLPVFA